MIDTAALIAAARSLLGVPFKHQGRNEFGLDCIGLVTLAMERAGAPRVHVPGVTTSPNYSRRVQPNVLELLEKHLCGRLAEPVAGSLIVFWFRADPQPRHHALMTESGTFVHANQAGPKPLRRVTETPLRGQWQRDAHSFWKLPGVRYE